MNRQLANVAGLAKQDTAAIDRSIHDGLSTEINLIIKRGEPSEEDEEARNNVINRLNELLAELFPPPSQISLSVFGSFVSNLYSRTSDLDLALQGVVDIKVFPKHPQLASKAAELVTLPLDKLDTSSRVVLLKMLVKFLMESKRVRGEVEDVTSARVPIIKFKMDGGHGVEIECDMCVGSFGKSFKNEVVKLMAGIDEQDRFSALIRLVKAWAQSHGVCDARNNMLNSWSLVLMVMFSLQTCSPPIFPPMWTLFYDKQPDPNSKRLLQGTTTDHLHKALGICTDRTENLRREGVSAANKSSVWELFHHFLYIFGTVIDGWSSSLASRPYQRTKLWRASVWVGQGWMWDFGRASYIFGVEDPFDNTDNAARSVGSHAQHNDTAGYISTVFITSLQLMKGVKSLADATRVLFWLFGLDLVSARPKDHSLDDSPLLSPSHAQRAGLLSFEMACNLHSNGDTFQQLEAMRLLLIGLGPAWQILCYDDWRIAVYGRSSLGQPQAPIARNGAVDPNQRPPLNQRMMLPRNTGNTGNTNRSAPAPGSQAGPHQPGFQQHGPYQAGPQQAGPYQPGSHQPGPQQPGFQHAGPYQPGFQQPGPHQPGPYQAGPQHAGPYQPGPQHAGPYQAGPQHAGPYQPGPQHAGPYQPGPQQPGPQQPGFQQAGPYQPGPHQPGPHHPRPGAQSARGHPAPPPGFECLRADMAVKLAIGKSAVPTSASTASFTPPTPTHPPSQYCVPPPTSPHQPLPPHPHPHFPFTANIAPVPTSAITQAGSLPASATSATTMATPLPASGGTGSPRHLLRNSSGGGSIPDQPPRHNSVSASLHSHPQHTTTAAAVLLSVAAAQQGLSPAGGSGAKQPPIPRQPAKLEPEGEEGKKERNRKGRHRNAEKAAGISNDTTTTTTDKISNKNNNSNNNNRMSRASNDGVGGGKAIHTSHAGSGGGGGGGGGRDKRVSRDGGSKKCDQ